MAGTSSTCDVHARLGVRGVDAAVEPQRPSAIGSFRSSSAGGVRSASLCHSSMLAKASLWRAIKHFDVGIGLTCRFHGRARIVIEQPEIDFPVDLALDVFGTRNVLKQRGLAGGLCRLHELFAHG